MEDTVGISRNDLVQRLRVYGDDYFGGDFRICHEAADEIEQLRAALNVGRHRSGEESMSIEWISRRTRVPDDRRQVLAWGISSPMLLPTKSHFMGTTRFNLSKDGGKFDADHYGSFGYWRVTHWAEITPPQENE